jgi:phosphohistidine phosphatase
MLEPPRLFLVRHAVAAERGPRWPDDDERPLTKAGAARMRRVVAGLAALGVDIDIVVTSPLKRAVQTADLVVQGLGLDDPPVVLPALAPGADAARVATGLAVDRRARGVALVGHEPGIGQLAAWCMGARAPLPFKKGGVCCFAPLEWPPAAGRATLVWFATPRMLRALGRPG